MSRRRYIHHRGHYKRKFKKKYVFVVVFLLAIVLLAGLIYKKAIFRDQNGLTATHVAIEEIIRLPEMYQDQEVIIEGELIPGHIEGEKGYKLRIMDIPSNFSLEYGLKHRIRGVVKYGFDQFMMQESWFISIVDIERI